MRGQDSRKRGKATDSLQDLLKNTKFEITGDQDGFIGEGISPDKKYKGYKTQAAGAPGASSPEDFETQQNKEKTRRILQNFDFNKLFYPSHAGTRQPRNAKSLNEGRTQKNSGRDEVVKGHTRQKNLPSQPPQIKKRHQDEDDTEDLSPQPHLVNLAKNAGQAAQVNSSSAVTSQQNRQDGQGRQRRGNTRDTSDSRNPALLQHFKEEKLNSGHQEDSVD